MKTTYITHLPIATPKLQELKLAVEFWSKMHAEAGLMKELAWQEYDKAIDAGLPDNAVHARFEQATLFEAICKDAWMKHEQAKRNLLDVLN